MTTSWLADRNATATAASATRPGETSGSQNAIAISANASSAWIASAQLRRRPSARVSTGIGTRSITGAQRNFRL